LILALIVLAGPLLAQRPALGAPNANHTVNEDGDQNDANTGDGVCDVDLGTAGLQCTLRAAIEQANASNGPDLIEFDASVSVIMPNSALPALSDATGGTTIRSVFNAVWVLGSFAGPATSGLVLSSDDNKVQGLLISNFGDDGVRVSGHSNVVGTDGDGVDDADERNYISANGSYGVEITGNGNRVAGNYIGTNVAGDSAASNGKSGVWIGSGAQHNLVGTDGDGTSDQLERNLISGNDEYGVSVAGSATMYNTVAGNYVGTNAAGDAAVPNGWSGVILGSSPFNTVGTDGDGQGDDAEGNLVSGNTANGVYLVGATTSDSVVAGNFIGTDASGAAALANGSDGVLIDGAVDNVIGGTAPGTGNLISGNDLAGVRLQTAAQGNLVQGNLIGTNASGTSALANGDHGIIIASGSTGNTIGGTMATARNVISGNGGRGVSIGSEGTTGNIIQGNFIGTDVSGVGALGNGASGVSFDHDAFDNVVGGVSSGAANRIAFNSFDGVRLYCCAARSGDSNVIRGNAIWGNTEEGIDLWAAWNDGPTPNDLGDADDGPNELQNYPVLTGAISGIETTITGTLNSQGDTPYIVDFYANSSCDPSGYGEGARFLGNKIVTTDGSGNTGFVVTLPGNVPAGHFIVATATDPFHNTSEFCACVTVVEAPYYAVFLPLVVRE
jgi:titin